MVEGRHLSLGLTARFNPSWSMVIALSAPQNLLCPLNFLYCPYLENPVYTYRIIPYNTEDCMQREYIHVTSLVDQFHVGRFTTIEDCQQREYENAFSNNTKRRDSSPLLC